jgi:hypothetical protein
VDAAARAPARRVRAEGVGPRHGRGGGLRDRRRGRGAPGARPLLALAAARRRRRDRRARRARPARLHAELRAGAWAEPEAGALAVMARVKERFDPARIFRPGTFVGGI